MNVSPYAYRLSIPPKGYASAEESREREIALSLLAYSPLPPFHLTQVPAPIALKSVKKQPHLIFSAKVSGFTQTKGEWCGFPFKIEKHGDIHEVKIAVPTTLWAVKYDEAVWHSGGKIVQICPVVKQIGGRLSYRPCEGVDEAHPLLTTTPAHLFFYEGGGTTLLLRDTIPFSARADESERVRFIAVSSVGFLYLTIPPNETLSIAETNTYKIKIPADSEGKYAFVITFKPLSMMRELGIPRWLTPTSLGVPLSLDLEDLKSEFPYSCSYLAFAWWVSTETLENINRQYNELTQRIQEGRGRVRPQAVFRRERKEGID